ncbi:SDR family oxidoreductase [Roseospirillum parvum]|uniref:Nucleoside-diphosphate-sugar epimerase n=1 Tax=Roseospirillum parvum TaxID=83401 RepID=A0A1G7TNG8_9PROT|nr:SDR family oxidoreductase [Roseospirillum parvum]SDG36564.1 Nucleoside-diphosphate-sugar epimerase [Roseospirillum parvum]
MQETPVVLIFGQGYSGRVLADDLRARGWTVRGTHRGAADPAAGLWTFDAEHRLPPEAFEGVTHVLDSIPPAGDGDPLPLAVHRAELAALPGLRWAGYLSTTGVYGNTDGAWVDEESPLAPGSARGARRVAAERAWLESGLPGHVFRLAGIYGPGRSAIDSLEAGTARRIVKPGQVFCRIHVADIARVVAASMERPSPGTVYNVCDDLPAPPQEVIAHAAHLLGVEPPPEEPLESANLSPMAMSFYADNRRVSNRRIKEELGVTLAHPDYRSGLAAQLAARTAG